MIVTLNGLTLNDDIPDGSGVLWYLTGLEGWDSPDIKSASVDPTSRHGSVIAKGLLAARALTLTGLCKSPTLNEHYASLQRLQGYVAQTVVPFPMTGAEDVVRGLDVVRAGRVRTAPAGLRAFTFDIPLIAPDPLKYAVTPVVTVINAGATVALTNAGNFTSERYTVTADADGVVSLSNSAYGEGRLVTADVVASGTVFDALDRTVTSGGRPIQALSPHAVWPGLVPGSNSITNHGTAAVSITHRSVWL